VWCAITSCRTVPRKPCSFSLTPSFSAGPEFITRRTYLRWPALNESCFTPWVGLCFALAPALIRVAFPGMLHLHLDKVMLLRKRSSQSNKKEENMAIWLRPLLLLGRHSSRAFCQGHTPYCTGSPISILSSSFTPPCCIMDSFGFPWQEVHGFPSKYVSQSSIECGCR
jgi:hypothetical protein